MKLIKINSLDIRIIFLCSFKQIIRLNVQQNEVCNFKFSDILPGSVQTQVGWFLNKFDVNTLITNDLFSNRLLACLDTGFILVICYFDLYYLKFKQISYNMIYCTNSDILRIEKPFQYLRHKYHYLQIKIKSYKLIAFKKHKMSVSNNRYTIPC